MGLVGLPIICEELIRHGRRADTPVALVERATSQDQRLISGTLGSIVALVEDVSPQPPTLIIIGNVVKLAGTLRWYGSG
jgi:uroporphyrin-III C-methyltransferase/precorrin-2 dehydrogenase/sirohydrochlorin ferrochelatase